eukprot:s652_g26.t1
MIQPLYQVPHVPRDLQVGLRVRPDAADEELLQNLPKGVLEEPAAQSHGWWGAVLAAVSQFGGSAFGERGERFALPASLEPLRCFEGLEISRLSRLLQVDHLADVLRFGQPDAVMAKNSLERSAGSAYAGAMMPANAGATAQARLECELRELSKEKALEQKEMELERKERAMEAQMLQLDLERQRLELEIAVAKRSRDGAEEETYERRMVPALPADSWEAEVFYWIKVAYICVFNSKNEGHLRANTYAEPSTRLERDWPTLRRSRLLWQTRCGLRCSKIQRCDQQKEGQPPDETFFGEGLALHLQGLHGALAL